MAPLAVFLFGKFTVKCHNQVVPGFEARKVQELFGYLLVNRNRTHPRELLAEILWEQGPQPRKYLRKTLWQLQTALNACDNLDATDILHADPEWLQIKQNDKLRLDISLFEQTYDKVRGIPGDQLDSHLAQLLAWAVSLHQGPLLEGWYADWCIYARERLQYLYLAMLDKLMDYFESCQDYETGIYHGLAALNYEPAREDTHRRIMRMQYLSGDRTEAIRQYERCVAALQRELDVTPTPQTVNLYEQIRTGQRLTPLTPLRPILANPPLNSASSVLLDHLRSVEIHLADIHQQVQQDIAALEQYLE